MLSEYAIGNTFAKPSAWKVLSVLLRPPFVAHQQHEIATSLGVADATVQRALKSLIEPGFVVRRRRQYFVNVGHIATRYFWLLRQIERELALPAEVRHALSVLTESEQLRGSVVVLFGSWAQEAASRLESDLDIAAFSDSLPKGSERSFSGRFTIDLHRFSQSDLHSVKNSAALDAVLNGIPLTGRDAVFDAVTEVRTFPKGFLLYRLDQAVAQLHRSAFLAESNQPDAAAFFRDLSERTLGQIGTILEQGRTQSWRTMPTEFPAEELIVQIRERLAQEGSQIWLT